MRVQLQNDPSAHKFFEQLLNIGNGERDLQPNRQCIQLQENFSTILEGKMT